MSKREIIGLGLIFLPLITALVIGTILSPFIWVLDCFLVVGVCVIVGCYLFFGANS